MPRAYWLNAQQKEFFALLESTQHPLHQVAQDLKIGRGSKDVGLGTGPHPALSRSTGRGGRAGEDTRAPRAGEGTGNT